MVPWRGVGGRGGVEERRRWALNSGRRRAGGTERKGRGGRLVRPPTALDSSDGVRGGDCRNADSCQLQKGSAVFEGESLGVAPGVGSAGEYGGSVVGLVNGRGKGVEGQDRDVDGGALENSFIVQPHGDFRREVNDGDAVALDFSVENAESVSGAGPFDDAEGCVGAEDQGKFRCGHRCPLSGREGLWLLVDCHRRPTRKVYRNLACDPSVFAGQRTARWAGARLSCRLFTPRSGGDLPVRPSQTAGQRAAVFRYREAAGRPRSGPGEGGRQVERAQRAVGTRSGPAAWPTRV